MLDTNVLSESLAKTPNPGVLGKLEVHASTLALASVTWQELLYGMSILEPGRRRALIQDYLLSRVQSMSAVAIELPDEAIARLQRLSTENGVTPADMATNAVLEWLDDMDDLRLAEQRWADSQRNPLPPVPLSELINRYSLDD
ncbi:PIN domain-containing protein [Thiorhodovibrio winogradskyi]|uniref:PIN domain-containing protein n=1 Tax=Thiorhodovibrio winogradskyi TaxID=77007 RepID=UPI002E2CD2E9|nr:PIN domain-containing protein [Thiorhodovibrio winogradskyi]